MQIWLALGVTVILAAVHVFGGQLRLAGRSPRSRILSIAGGTSVAYVFVHLLPEAAHFSAQIEQVGGVERPIYVAALAGVVVFYGLERWAVIKSPDDATGRGEGGDATEPPDLVFWIHIGSFALYNALIGYLLVRESLYGPGELALFALAMGTHFLVNDVGLRELHRTLYRRIGRWLLAAAAVSGWVIGILIELHPAVTGGLFGFLCGATVLNVLKEELPAERDSRFWAFAGGAAVFAALLMMLPQAEAEHETSPTEQRESPTATRPGLRTPGVPPQAQAYALYRTPAAPA